MSINYNERIPNNVDISENRRLQRALEAWQPHYLDWWRDMGPENSTDMDVYLRTAISVDPKGWAQFGYVKMPDYRWGIFLTPPEADRKINFGDHKGEPAWQDVPGEYRSTLVALVSVPRFRFFSGRFFSSATFYIFERIFSVILHADVTFRDR